MSLKNQINYSIHKGFTTEDNMYHVFIVKEDGRGEALTKDFISLKSILRGTKKDFLIDKIQTQDKEAYQEFLSKWQ